jgi:AcrR family transcriptional regulator
MTTKTMHPTVHRTQEQRSTATRGRLLDATIECLYELGYTRTTTTVIAERAGLSRGAQLHHFPTKAELVTTAVERLLERRTEEFRQAFAQLPTDTNRAVAAVDLLWPIVSGPTFYAWLELLVAARTDAELRATVAEIAERFSETVQKTFAEFFAPPLATTPFFDQVPHFTLALLQGLALDTISKQNNQDDQRISGVLEVLKTLSQLVLQRNP